MSVYPHKKQVPGRVPGQDPFDLFGAPRNLRVEENFGSGYVRLKTSEAERRQAIQDIPSPEAALFELLRNAYDAGARHIFVASVKEENRRYLTVIDDGEGVPQHMHERIFEARVTGKLNSAHVDAWGFHGRGMALFSIAQNAETAKIMKSSPGQGTSLHVVFDTNTIPERTDQSTWPQLLREGNPPHITTRGPHNYYRVCSDFYLETEGKTRIYIGSFAELTSRICERAAAHKLSGENLILSGLTSAKNARSLTQSANELGLFISTRSAHRILAGEINMAVSVGAYLSRSRRSSAAISSRSSRQKQKGLSISSEDLDIFTASITRDFQELAEKYYLLPSGTPKVRIIDNRINVDFPFITDE